jgi:hypothetical protein
MLPEIDNSFLLHISVFRSLDFKELEIPISCRRAYKSSQKRGAAAERSAESNDGSLGY